ncbi:unnamed protein product [Heterotrigona itama]|uniref:Uncharacterized protein n=1 Tax=Heterotrigona itama TaxID=395501 RepID=A0A6V7GRW5_9HYME|nr:unnamed protein product [Heterotrigona itama]
MINHRKSISQIKHLASIEKKLLVNEATVHVKNENYYKALCLYNKVKSANTQNAIDSKIMGILNSTIHHHDLLQSYVRAPVESASGSKQLEESENFDKIPSSLGTYFDKELNDDDDKESHIGGDKKDRKNKQRESKSNKLSVESEMNIQKRKK